MTLLALTEKDNAESVEIAQNFLVYEKAGIFEEKWQVIQEYSSLG